MQVADDLTLRRVAPWASIGLAATGAALLLPPWLAGVAAIVLVLTPLICWLVFSVQHGWLALFFFALLLLPPVPLPAGDSGPHPSVLLAALGVLVGIARLPEWGRSRFAAARTSALDLAFAALLIALFISVGFAALYSGPALALASAARVMLLGIGVYVYFAAVHGPERQTSEAAIRTTLWLFWFAMAAALFACVDFLFHFPTPAGFEPQFIWVDSGVYRRAQGFFYESSTLGNFCAFFLVFIGVSLTQLAARRLVSTGWLCVGAVLFASALLLSFSRSSVLAVIIAFGVLACFERRRWSRHRGLVLMAGLAVLAVIVFAVTVPEVAGGYWGRLNIAWENLVEAPDRALSGRLESWSTLASFIGDHPWQTIFGIGYKTLPYTEYLGHPVIADNMYLSLLVETGVFGLISLIALNVAILRVCWRAMRCESFYGKWLFCFWIAEIFQMFTGDILTYWRVLPVYFWVLAQAVQDSNLRKSVVEN